MTNREDGRGIGAKRKAYIYGPPTKRLNKPATKLYKTESIDDIENLLEEDPSVVITDDDGDGDGERDAADELYESIFNDKGGSAGKKGSSSGVDELIKKMKAPVVVASEEKHIHNEPEEEEEEEEEELIEILKNDQILVRRTEAKYSRKNFKPKVYTKKQLLDKAKHYYGIIPRILKGDLKSYFYGLGLKLMKESTHDTIQSWEFRNLPFHLLQCGYIGKKRSMIVKNKIFLKFNTDLTRSKDKVLHYFGIDNFITYILLPELISFFIKDEFKLSNIDKLIDLMELTNDYGLYIMDKIDPIEQDYDSELEDDEEMRLTKLDLNIVPPPPPHSTGPGVSNFVQNIIGISDSDSDSDDM